MWEVYLVETNDMKWMWHIAAGNKIYGALAVLMSAKRRIPVLLDMSI